MLFISNKLITYEVGAQANFKTTPTFKNQTPIYVVENWRSDDGTGWYRKWSDGWIEQGGVSYKSGENTFFINFSNTEYTIIATQIVNSGSAWSPQIGRISTSTWSYFQYQNKYAAMWYACGF